jgi:hypothetical protein
VRAAPRHYKSPPPAPATRRPPWTSPFYPRPSTLAPGRPPTPPLASRSLCSHHPNHDRSFPRLDSCILLPACSNFDACFCPRRRRRSFARATLTTTLDHQPRLASLTLTLALTLSRHASTFADRDPRFHCPQSTLHSRQRQLLNDNFSTSLSERLFRVPGRLSSYPPATRSSPRQSSSISTTCDVRLHLFDQSLTPLENSHNRTMTA